MKRGVVVTSKISASLSAFFKQCTNEERSELLSAGRFEISTSRVISFTPLVFSENPFLSPLSPIICKSILVVGIPISIQSLGRLKSASHSSTFLPCFVSSNARFTAKKARSTTFTSLVMQIDLTGMSTPLRWPSTGRLSGKGRLWSFEFDERNRWEKSSNLLPSFFSCVISLPWGMRCSSPFETAPSYAQKFKKQVLQHLMIRNQYQRIVCTELC